MGSGSVGNYQGTAGSFSQYRKELLSNSGSKTIKNNKNKIKSKNSGIFNEKGTVTIKSISDNREKLLNKSPNQIADLISREGGYTTIERKSTHRNSKAKILMITNQSKERNISQIQISPGSKRHGDVPYIKISTTNIGKIKIVDCPKLKYVTDGKEKATILFRRKNK